jgi:hypothetical protein
MCANLQSLGWYFDDANYHTMSQNMLSKAMPQLLENSVSNASWLPSLMWSIEEPYEVALVGKEAQAYLNKWAANYQPDVILFGGTAEGNLPFMQFKLEEGKTSIYVCRNKICKKPVYEVKTALQMVK